MRELNDIEDLFVREVLDTHGEYIVDLLQDSIEEKKLHINFDLLDSLNYKVVKSGSDYILQISFLSYGRAVEIQFFKSKRLRKEASAKQQSSDFRRAKKKDTRFYAKNVYGSINRLLGRMSSEYSDQEIARLKGILENRINTSI